MRLAEILGCRVHDADGIDIGGVHDVRFAVQRGIDGESPGARVAALVVGGASVGHRLGYARHEMVGPWPLTALFRRLARRSFLVEWDDVERFERPRIDIRRGRDGLRRLGEDGADNSR